MHHNDDLSVDTLLNELRLFSAKVAGLSNNLNDWLLGGNTKEEALLYKVFDDNTSSAAAKAVLETRLKGKSDPRCIVMWNGREGHAGASMEFIGRPKNKISLINFVGRPESFSSNWQLIVDTIKASVAIWHPTHITLESNGYYEHRTFKDRPGVGWMLYLPLALTAQQVPEARALVPVMDKDMKGKIKQIGTIIVSVTDAPFSDENPDHVAIANAIEIRLVDQDLLPRYADF